MKKWLFGIGLVMLVLYLSALLAIPRISPRPDGLGVNNGQLKPCPGKPNCVSTQSTATDDYEKRAAIALAAGEGASSVMPRLVSIIEQMPRTTIIEQNDTYVYAEFRTFAMRFIDDVEFWVDEEQNLIHYRSASRLGRKDFGVNGKRMDQIITKYKETK